MGSVGRARDPSGRVRSRVRFVSSRVACSSMAMTTSTTTTAMRMRMRESTTIRGRRAVVVSGRAGTTRRARGRDVETKAMFNFTPADEPKKLEVRRYMDAGKGTKLVKRKAPPKPLYKSKPRAKKVTAPKPVKTKTQVKKVVTKKPIVAKKKAIVSKKKPVVPKKKAIVSKKKPVVSKKKPVVSKKKPLVTKKPMVRAKPVMRPKPVRRAAPRRTRPASINNGMSLQETADLGYYAIIAGAFLLSSAILP